MQEMRLTAVVSVGLWCLTVAVVDAQLFTASSDLSAAFQLERQVVNVLGELVAKAQAKIDTIRKYLEDYESVIEEQALTEDDFMERVAGKQSRSEVKSPLIKPGLKNGEWISLNNRGFLCLNITLGNIHHEKVTVFVTCFNVIWFSLQ